MARYKVGDEVTVIKPWGPYQVGQKLWIRGGPDFFLLYEVSMTSDGEGFHTAPSRILRKKSSKQTSGKNC